MEMLWGKNVEKYKVLSFIVLCYLPRQGSSTDILLSPTFVFPPSGRTTTPTHKDIWVGMCVFVQVQVFVRVTFYLCH